MTWTVILFDGESYSRQIFFGSHDGNRAFKEAGQKLAPSSEEGKVILLIPGEHPVYVSPKKA